MEKFTVTVTLEVRARDYEEAAKKAHCRLLDPSGALDWGYTVVVSGGNAAVSYDADTIDAAVEAGEEEDE